MTYSCANCLTDEMEDRENCCDDPDHILFSDCCGEEVDPDVGLCPRCKEHV